MLAQLKSEVAGNDQAHLALARRLACDPRDPRLKLLVTWQTLQFRRRHAELFRSGEYIPVAVEGAKARHVCAFARLLQSAAGTDRPIAIVVAPRLIAQLTPAPQNALAAPPPLGEAVWEDTSVVVEGLVSSPLRHLFTGQVCAPSDGRLRVAAALADFPVAVLTNP
jgi:(1->4)-alpha-D-glucan 1-alpha-D-glucosylmutase